MFDSNHLSYSNPIFKSKFFILFTAGKQTSVIDRI